MASEKYRNIQVLKNIPADDLMNTMNFMAAALRVNCNHCHVPNQFDKDDKPAKETARRMIRMMWKVNQENFDGRAVVNCYSCHGGKTKPAIMPPVAPIPALAASPAVGGSAPQPESRPAAAQPLPSSDQIMKKYVQALGGQAALEKLTSREVQGHLQAGPRQVPITLLQKAPNRWLIEIQAPEATALTGYDGKIGWSLNMRKEVNEESGEQLEILKRDAEFHRAIRPATSTTLKVVGLEKIEEAQAYIVEAESPSGSMETLYFDVNSGLLLRSLMIMQTGLGPLPFQEDFQDYRDIDGIKFPFLVRRSRAEVSFFVRYSKVLHNIPIADAKFEKPISSENNSGRAPAGAAKPPHR